MSDVIREQGDLFVGVRRNSDGTLNFDKALRMERPKEIVERERQETLDRLRGPLVMDAKRDARYQNFIEEVSEIHKEGKLASWFASQLNSLTRADRVPIQVTAEDLQGIEFIVDSPQSTALSTTFGIDVKRPFSG